MKFVKNIKDKEVVIECDNENLFSLYLREGFTEAKEVKIEKKHK